MDVVRSENVRGFGHEMYAAENDVLRVFLPPAELSQFEAISGEICELDDVVALA